MATYRELYRQLCADDGFLEDKIRAAVSIAQHDVLVNILEQSQIFMQWSYMHILADMEAKKAKVYWQEVVVDKCRERAERDLLDEGRKNTQKAVDGKLTTYPDYKQAQTAYFDAEQKASVLKAVVESLRQKKDMLQSLNSRQKVELGDYANEYVPRATIKPPEENDPPGTIRYEEPAREPSNDLEDLKARYRAKLAQPKRT